MSARPLALLLAVAALLAVVAPSTAAPRPSSRVAIATATSVDYRVVVWARQKAPGAAPIAAITVVTYTRAGSGWHRAGNQALPGTYFWKTVTARRGLCRLDIRTAGETTTPHVTVQLLQTPSIGCAPPQTIALPPK